jgi:SAM-dependent methyltransferase
VGKWTRAHLRHIGSLFRFGARPAVRVYESIGDDFFLAPAPGWLNLGWWEGDGDESEAERACERLVEQIAQHLPRDAVVLDVANGLGAQDAVIARIARPRALVALNLTEFQLHAGRARLREAHAQPLNADATRIPLRDASVDGVISVEAAFHFPSRAAFFAEARRVLRAGGVLTMSDISAERGPHNVREAVAGVTQLRFWGIRRRMLASAGEITHLAEEAGFEDVRVEICTARVIDPAVRLTRARLHAKRGAPKSQVFAGRWLLRQVDLLRRAGMMHYLLLHARAPYSAR